MVLYTLLVFCVTTYITACEFSVKNFIAKNGQPRIESDCHNNNELSLAGRGLTSLDGLDLVERAPAVQYLMCCYNEIEELPARAVFEKFENLEEFWITSNKLQQIPPQAFKYNQAVLWLSFNYNQISKIYSTSFVNLGNLVDLHLCGNKLRQLPNNAFEHLHNLKFLDLGENQLDKIPALNGLNNLKVLLLNDNNITHVGAHDLMATPQLKKVDLKNNPLVTIAADFFDKKDLKEVCIGTASVKISATAQQFFKLATILKE